MMLVMNVATFRFILTSFMRQSLMRNECKHVLAHSHTSDEYGNAKTKITAVPIKAQLLSEANKRQ